MWEHPSLCLMDHASCMKESCTKAFGVQIFYQFIFGWHFSWRFLNRFTSLKRHILAGYILWLKTAYFSSVESSIGSSLILICARTVDLNNLPSTRRIIPVKDPLDTRPMTPVQTSPARFRAPHAIFRDSCNIDIRPVESRVSPPRVPTLTRVERSTRSLFRWSRVFFHTYVAICCLVWSARTMFSCAWLRYPCDPPGGSFWSMKGTVLVGLYLALVFHTTVFPYPSLEPAFWTMETCQWHWR